MLNVGPVDIVVALLLLARRFGPGRTLLGAVGLAIGVQPLLPPVSCGCLGPVLRRCTMDGRYQAGMKSDLENLASQQEVYFSDALRYGDDARALAFTPSDGVRVTVRATKDAWTAWATHAALGPTKGCAIFQGGEEPMLDALAPAWADELMDGADPGVVRCI